MRWWAWGVLGLGLVLAGCGGVSSGGGGSTELTSAGSDCDGHDGGTDDNPDAAVKREWPPPLQPVPPAPNYVQ